MSPRKMSVKAKYTPVERKYKIREGEEYFPSNNHYIPVNKSLLKSSVKSKMLDVDQVEIRKLDPPLKDK